MTSLRYVVVRSTKQEHFISFASIVNALIDLMTPPTINHLNVLVYCAFRHASHYFQMRLCNRAHFADSIIYASALIEVALDQEWFLSRSKRIVVYHWVVFILFY